MASIKNYEIILEKYFPENHPNAAQPTRFRDRFLLALQCPDCPHTLDLSKTINTQCAKCSRADLCPKSHLIKGNFDLWEKRINEVQLGKATLSIKQWAGTPHKSFRETLMKFDYTSSIGVQKIRYRYGWEVECPNQYDSNVMAAKNGTTFENWLAEFREADKTKPMAIIHFTDFRY